MELEFASGTNTADTPTRVLYPASSGDTEPSWSTQVPQTLRRIGRFTVLEELGHGGMGVVYAAYDERIDRKIAIKLVRDRGTGGSAETMARMRREAQAMAQLSHPNVVQVYDVGEHDGGLFVAMEFIPGETMRTRIKQGDSDWHELVPLFIAAGRGLEAAHAVGLIHRDFKPDNVMVRHDDGRVLVLDFGLARLADSDGTLDDSVQYASHSSLGSGQLTEAGSRLGTPAYMAPEQHRGEAIGPAADQFSFCVALWEGIFGKRPFAADTAVGLAFAVTTGKRRPPPKDRKVPQWLRRALDRGLEIRPEDRFPSMRALLAALERGLARHVRRRVLVGLAMMAGFAAAVGAYAWHDRAEREARCVDASLEVHQRWGDEGRARVRAGLEATGLGYASVTADRVIPWLDQWVERWRLAREETCRSVTVRSGSVTPALAERADDCLGERRAAFEALVEQLVQADSTTLRMATAAAANLPAPTDCTDARNLATRPDIDIGDRDEARELRRLIVRADELRSTGQYDSGIELLRPVVARAEAHGDGALEAEARVVLGSLLRAQGSFDEAETELRAGYVKAGTGHAPGTVARAAIGLVGLVGNERRRHSEALIWIEAARVAVRAVRTDSQFLSQQLRGVLASIHFSRGEFKQAEELCTALLVELESAYGPEHPRVLLTTLTLAHILESIGESERAISQYERVLGAYEAAFGPNHPRVALALSSLAAAIGARGEVAEAIALEERALSIRRKALGGGHFEVAGSLNNLAANHHRLGDYKTARPLYEQALAIWERHLGASHPTVALGLVNLGTVNTALGEFDDAMSQLSRARALYEADPDLDKQLLAHALVASAVLAVERGSPAEGLEDVARALELQEQLGLADSEIATTQFVQARALWATPAADGGDRKRALELAQNAREELARARTKPQSLSEIEEWLSLRQDAT